MKDFENKPTNNDIERFIACAERVRHVRHVYRLFNRRRQLKRFVELACGRFSLKRPLLPHLQSLAWSTSLDANDIVPCVPLDLTGLTLYLSGNSPLDPLFPFLGSLANLRFIDRGGYSDTDISSILERCPTVRNITLVKGNSMSLTHDIVGAIHSLPELRVFRVNQGHCPEFLIRSPDPGALQKLSTLHLSVGLSVVASFLDVMGPWASLNELSISTYTVPHTSRDVHSFSTALSSSCHNIKILDVWLETRLQPSLSNSHPQLTMDHLSPLLNKLKPTNFGIYYPDQLDASDAQMDGIASSWPQLVTLHLTPWPAESPTAKLTPAALIPFAENCAGLADLGLYLDPANPPPVLPDLPRLQMLHAKVLSHLESSETSPLPKFFCNWGDATICVPGFGEHIL